MSRRKSHIDYTYCCGKRGYLSRNKAQEALDEALRSDRRNERRVYGPCPDRAYHLTSQTAETRKTRMTPYAVAA